MQFNGSYITDSRAKPILQPMYLFKIQRELSLKLLEKPGIKVIHKVTRAGATTSLVEVSLEKGLQVVIVVPRKKIGFDLINRLSRMLIHTPRMALIGSNEQLCLKLHKIDVAFQFRKKCRKCEINNPEQCPFQKLITQEFDLLSLTYSKLEALLAHRETFASQRILDKITSADVIIFDEFSNAVLPSIPTIALIEKGEDGKISKLREDLLNHFAELEQWNDLLIEFIREFEEKPSGVYENPVFDHIDEFKEKRMFKKGWRLITELTVKGSDTRSLQRIFLAMYSRKVVILNDEGNITLTPSVDDSLWYIKSFIGMLGTEKRVFVIDSYQPCSNFESIFGQAEPVLWGDKGDPLKTNAMQMIIADTAHWGVLDFFRDSRLQEKYREILKRIIRCFSCERVAIVCTNKRMAAAIHGWDLRGLKSRSAPLITWYRSELTRGVQLKNRDIVILVGGPYLPKRAYLAQSKSFKVEDFVTEMEALQTDEEKLAELPHLLRLDDMRGEFINTVGRVKDPEGMLRSVVICCGIRESEVKSLLRDNSPFRLSKPKHVRTIGASAMLDEGFLISALWMFRRSITKPEELRILARIISLAHQKRSIPASQVILGSTELVKAVALQHQEVLMEFGVKIVYKTGGTSFALPP